MNPSLALPLLAQPLLAAQALPRPVPTMPLTRFVLLAMLLHLWLVLVVGTTSGLGGARGDGPGAPWGPVQIRLGGAGPADSAGRSPLPQPATMGPVGLAPALRFGGAAHEAETRPTPQAGAAALGPVDPNPVPAPRPSTAATAPLQTPQPAAVPPPPVLTRLAPAEAAPRPQADEASARAAPPAALPPGLEPAAAPSTAPRLAPVETVEAPVLRPSDAAAPDITLPAPHPAALPQALPAPAPRRQQRAEQPPAVPRVEAALPPLRVPAEALQAPPALPAPAAEPPPSAAALPPPPIPREAPLPAPPVSVAPPPLPAFELPRESLSAPAMLRPVPPVADIEALPPGSSATTITPAGRAADPGATTPAPARPGAAAGPAPGTRPGAPGPAVGSSAGARSPAAGASAPPLNLALPRGVATAPDSASPRVLNLVPPPPERKSTLAEKIEKSAKPDCRNAYAAMGPLAVLPLLGDALRDGGCRW